MKCSYLSHSTKLVKCSYCNLLVKLDWQDQLWNSLRQRCPGGGEAGLLNQDSDSSGDVKQFLSLNEKRNISCCPLLLLLSPSQTFILRAFASRPVIILLKRGLNWNTIIEKTYQLKGGLTCQPDQSVTPVQRFEGQQYKLCLGLNTHTTFYTPLCHWQRLRGSEAVRTLVRGDTGKSFHDVVMFGFEMFKK